MKFSRALRSRPRLIETLETRRLLATIEGTIWNDVDTDGLFDFFEEPQPGVTVFIDANENRLLDAGETSTVTDEEGRYSFTDLAPGEYFITHKFLDDEGNPEYSQTAPGIAGRSNLEGDFDIEIVYVDTNLDERQKAVVESAINKWEQAIIGDLPDVNVGGETIDDLRVFVTGAQVDGPSGILAFARPSAFRVAPDTDPLLDDFGNPRGLPYEGQITVDLPDSVASRGFVETVVHEVGHVLGIGSLWSGFLSGSGGPNVVYTGANAVRELNTIFDVNANAIPVQVNVEGHWRQEFGRPESAFNNLGTELMTPFSSGGFEAPPDADPFAPLSRITIGAMEDFGFEVNYGAAEPYGPFGIGALPGDLTGELASRAFSLAYAIATDDDVIDDANFGVRENDKPNNFNFNVGPEVVANGQTLRLLAEIDTTEDRLFDGDTDFRDRIVQVNFHLESNGQPGLQTPGMVRRGLATTADTLLVEDADASDGYDFDLNPVALADGEYTVYAQAFDRGYLDTVRERIIVVDSTATEASAKPVDLRVFGISTNEFLVEFQDRATNETGFVLQVSTEAGFDVPEAITSVFLPAQEGTGLYSTVYEIPSVDPDDASNEVRYFRVRSFNTFANSAFAGRPSARTLGPGEVFVDNADEDRVTFTGFGETADPDGSTGARALTYLRGTSGSATYRPMFEDDGTFLVFARGLDLGSNTGETLVEVFNGDGNRLGSRTLDAGDAGSDVLLGTFDLDEDAYVVFTATGTGISSADTVRFLPSGD